MKRKTKIQLMESVECLEKDKKALIESAQRRHDTIDQLEKGNKALLERRQQLYDKIERLELEVQKYSSRLPHLAVVGFMIISLAAGLYIGHKVTQRGNVERVKAARDYGYEVGVGEGFARCENIALEELQAAVKTATAGWTNRVSRESETKLIMTNCIFYLWDMPFRVVNVTNRIVAPRRVVGAPSHRWGVTYNKSKDVLTIHLQRYYRTIVHAKGAERLRGKL